MKESVISQEVRTERQILVVQKKKSSALDDESCVRDLENEGYKFKEPIFTYLPPSPRFPYLEYGSGSKAGRFLPWDMDGKGDLVVPAGKGAVKSCVA